MNWTHERLLAPKEGEFAVCILAIDRFDRLQQTYPQNQIDLILQSVARRLKHYHSDATHLAYCNSNQFVFTGNGGYLPDPSRKYWDILRYV